MMNARAQELGMTNTLYTNATGLPDDQQHTTARDVAALACEVCRHPEYFAHASVWMDTLTHPSGRTTDLTNTNRLVRFYPGCTGLKTGSTAKAGFCVSVTAEREGLSLICVIMGSETRDTRNASATKLLDWGFANFALATVPAGSAGEIRVTGGTESVCHASYPAFSAVVPKGARNNVRHEITLMETLAAEVTKGQCVGEVVYYCGDREIGRAEVTADATVPKISYFEIFLRMARAFLLKACGG